MVTSQQATRQLQANGLNPKLIKESRDKIYMRTVLGDGVGMPCVIEVDKHKASGMFRVISVMK